MTQVSNFYQLTERERKAVVEMMRNDYKVYFDTIRVNSYRFYPKMKFMFGDREVFSLYKSELEKPEGFYTEVIDKNYAVSSSIRQLLFLPYDPEFEKRFQSFGTDKFAVPCADLEVVNTGLAFMGKNVGYDMPIETTPPVETASPAPQELRPAFPVPESILPDVPYQDLTARDHMALMVWKPISNKSWINDIISKHPKLN